MELTPRAITRLKNEKKHIQEVLLPEIRKRLTAANEDGDLPENNPWLTAKEDLEATRIRLFEIDDILATATIITKTKHKTILLGDTVTIEFMSKKETFTLVSSIEANPKKNFLSVDSPIGKEILHNKPGDIVFVKTPVGKISVKILTKS
ncbi:MAG: GreA/GreB family elongation factor [Candidatus Dojkabacteria bacterium]|nr:MAG: GreA/GreB family elongation factor [Candidatus Dojkabacteria bacterium]